MEGDDDELEDSPQQLDDVKSVHTVSSYFAHVLTRHDIYLRAASIHEIQ